MKQYGTTSTYIKVVLLPYETYRMSSVYDLSVTLITSTDHIAMVRGHVANHITTGGANPFMEMVTQTDQWDRV